MAAMVSPTVDGLLGGLLPKNMGSNGISMSGPRTISGSSRPTTNATKSQSGQSETDLTSISSTNLKTDKETLEENCIDTKYHEAGRLLPILYEHHRQGSPVPVEPSFSIGSEAHDINTRGDPGRQERIDRMLGSCDLLVSPNDDNNGAVGGNSEDGSKQFASGKISADTDTGTSVDNFQQRARDESARAFKRSEQGETLAGWSTSSQTTPTLTEDELKALKKLAPLTTQSRFDQREAITSDHSCDNGEVNKAKRREVVFRNHAVAMKKSIELSRENLDLLIIQLTMEQSNKIVHQHASETRAGSVLHFSKRNERSRDPLWPF